MTWSIVYDPARSAINFPRAPGIAAAVLAGLVPVLSGSGGPGFYPAGHWIAAKQAMIQVYPRPDTETLANARHHWAYYDGVNPVQYIIPIGVSFGAYPYVFRLLQGPSGMAIGQSYGAANYGVITWTPAGAVTNQTVSVLVTDQQSNTLTITFTVSTSSALAQFIFVDSTHGSDSNTGAITAPFQTLSKAFGSTYSASANAGAICYMRGSAIKYSMVGYTDNDFLNGQPWFEMNTSTKPCALLGFPGETATIDGTTAAGFAYFHNAPDWFCQGFTVNGYQSSFANVKMFYIVGLANENRQTFDSITWTNAGYGSAGNDNATGIHSSNGGGAYRQYIYIRAFAETGRQSGAPGNNYAGCDLYAQQFGLIELCNISSPSSAVDGALYMKADCSNFCMRNNIVDVGSAAHACSTGFIQNAGAPTGNVEISYNRVFGAPIQEMTQTQAGVGQHWVYRNSVIGNHIAPFTPNAGGPYTHESNAVQSPAPQVVTGSQSTDANTECEATSGVFDSNGLLTGSYRTNFLGMRGAEIA